MGATVQYFYSKGYVPTKEGWKNDCYELGHVEDCSDKECKPLFDKIQDYRDDDNNISPLHKRNTSRRDNEVDMRTCIQFCRSLCKEPEEPEAQRKILREEKKISEESLVIRKEHWDRIGKEENLEKLICANPPQLCRVDEKVEIENFFSKSEGIKMFIHFILTLAIFCTGVGSYL